MSVVSGLLTLTSVLSANGGNPDELANEWQETIFVRNSRGYNVGTSLFGLMSRLNKEPAENIEYNWFERDPIRKTLYATATATGTTGGTNLQLGSSGSATSGDDAYKWLTPGTVIMNDTTREYMAVSSATNATTITVTRDIAFTTQGGELTSSALGTVLSTDTFTIVTVGKAEGADAISAVYDAPITRTNYIQTFNSTVELTNAFKGSVLRSDLDGPLTDRRIQALEKIGRDIEFAMFLGAKRKTTTLTGWGSSGSGYLYHTGGIYNGLVAAGLTGAVGTLGANLITTTNSISLANFNTWLASILPFGSDTKIIFCGPKSFAAISNYANSQANGYRIMQNENVFGMNITEIQTPFGTVGLTQHPLMREAVGLQSWMFVVDLAHIVQKTYESLFLEPNIQNNGNDSYKEQYRAKLGVKMRFPQAFGVLSVANTSSFTIT